MHLEERVYKLKKKSLPNTKIGYVFTARGKETNFYEYVVTIITK